MPSTVTIGDDWLITVKVHRSTKTLLNPLLRDAKKEGGQAKKRFHKKKVKVPAVSFKHKGAKLH